MDRILVVDDDIMNLKMAEHILKKNYEVILVSSGQEALDFLAQETTDMILLDLHMPELNGLETMERIQAMDQASEIPVIFLTADNERETEIKIFNAGAMDYIQKPFLAEVVLRRIGRLLELFHLQQSLQQEVEKKTGELRESSQRIQRLSEQIMMSLASVIDAKDTYTRGHSMRVAEYARELARRMGKTPRELDNIYYSGLLHDIGKIGVSNKIINKPGRLTEEEYNVMRAHPEIGAEILGNISELPDISIGAHWHHEHYDGSGYPDRLAGEEIPEVARIIGVADAYDAMASRRSYRDVLPQEVVRKEIEKAKGIQFDPVIAEYMIKMIEEDKEYKMREQ
ncbi:MAG: response regulator [Lachnospiraceae bacterium]|nr:response regulator [Lachnospiraceae bacterium]